MSFRIAPYLLVASALGAATFAALRTETAPASPAASATIVDAVAGVVAPSDPHAALPPNHPPIGDHASALGSPAPLGAPAPSADEPAALAWKVPDAWKTVASPSAMRLATYQVPRPAGAGASADAELSVTRAGGSTEANIERWLRQFDDAGLETRTVKTVRGFKVTIVEVSGTYLGSGMMGGAAPPAKPGWALLAAIVETPGAPYFFKMTGEVKTVRAARAAFDALVSSIAPS